MLIVKGAKSNKFVHLSFSFSLFFGRGRGSACFGRIFSLFPPEVTNYLNFVKFLVLNCLQFTHFLLCLKKIDMSQLWDEINLERGMGSIVADIQEKWFLLFAISMLCHPGHVNVISQFHDHICKKINKMKT